jgi:hypothetical protein
MAISLHTGNTPVPDATWSDYKAVTNGGSIDEINRYIQYKASLASTDSRSTAVLQNMLITCNASFNVAITDLTATLINKDVRLNWSTEAEYNNKGFEIQKSLNGTDFTTIGFVDATGNSTVQRNYTYTDKDLEPGTYYYRLKQIDTDNRFRYSNIASVTIAGVSSYHLDQNFPNPFSETTTITYSVPKSARVVFSVFDMQGRLVLSLEEGIKNQGTYSINIHRGSLNHGIYYYRMQTGEFTKTKKMFVR